MVPVSVDPSALLKVVLVARTDWAAEIALAMVAASCAVDTLDADVDALKSLLSRLTDMPKRIDELPIAPIHVKMMLQTIRKLNRENARLRYMLSL